MLERTPGLGDRVKNKIDGFVGIVTSILYAIDTETYITVFDTVTDTAHTSSYMKNWEILKTRAEVEEENNTLACYRIMDIFTNTFPGLLIEDMRPAVKPNSLYIWLKHCSHDLVATYDQKNNSFLITKKDRGRMEE